MDEPIETQGEDELGIKDEVQEFSKYLRGRNSSTNLIASVQAPWGEGKSSFLNLVKAELESTQNNTIQVVRFNPWQFSGHQDLLQQFFTTFAESKGVSDEFKSALSSIGSLANLTALVPGLELVSLIGKVLDKGAGFANSIPSENIQQLRNEAKKQAGVSEQHHIFLIDELDRLESHEVRSFLQMLKAVADFPNTTYVLASDAEALEDLLKDSGVSNPRVYLEKIIGFSFCLPTIRMDDLQKHHLMEINYILDHQGLEPIDYDRWSTNEVYAALPNLRQCKRHVAHFEYLCRSIGKYVDTTDLAYVSIIQLLDPSLWRTIGENQTWFWGTSNGGSKPNQRLIDLKNKCLAQGKESVWQIVCIVYEGVVERSKLEGDNLFLPSGLGINKPIRAASNNSFHVYHTRKPASAWAYAETSLVKQAFTEAVDKHKLYKLMIDFPEESLLWIGSIILHVQEYEGMKTVCFISQFIRVLEGRVHEKACQKLLGSHAVYNVIKKAADIDLGKAVLNDQLDLKDQYKSQPLYYSLEVLALSRLHAPNGMDDLSQAAAKRLQLSHEKFWGQIETLIYHPFIHWAFRSYISAFKAKDSIVSSVLMKEVDGEVFWLKKDALPKVLLFVEMLCSEYSVRDDLKRYVKNWKLVLGEEPDFSMLLQKMGELEGLDETQQHNVTWHQPLMMDILTEEPSN